MKSKYSKLAALSCAAMLTFSGCVEHIDEGARFTFVGNTVATYLEEQEQCSHFVEILTRGEQIGLMKAYGQYTCFAPTNEAFAIYFDRKITASYVEQQPIMTSLSSDCYRGSVGMRSA